MKKFRIFAAASFPLICSVSASATSYVCVNDKDDVITFSGDEATGFSNFVYQSVKGEFMTGKRLILRKNGNGMQIVGTLSADAKFSGFSASFAVTDNGLKKARIRFSDEVGMPIVNDVYECSIEARQ